MFNVLKRKETLLNLIEDTEKELLNLPKKCEHARIHLRKMLGYHKDALMDVNELVRILKTEEKIPFNGFDLFERDGNFYCFVDNVFVRAFGSLHAAKESILKGYYKPENFKTK